MLKLSNDLLITVFLNDYSMDLLSSKLVYTKIKVLGLHHDKDNIRDLMK